MLHRSLVLVSAFALMAGAVQAQTARPGVVDPAWVTAHETFLAGDALRGRGSATPDEAVAAAYVASQFMGFGLKPAPGMDGYLQTVPVVMTTPSGQAKLSLGDDVAVSQGQGLTVVSDPGENVEGRIVTPDALDMAGVSTGDVVLVSPTDAAAMRLWANTAFGKGAKMVVVEQTEALSDQLRPASSRTRVSLAGAAPRRAPALMAMTPDIYDRLAAQPGARIVFDPGTPVRTEGVTTNALGYLPGSDPSAGVILISAHLDHLGVRPDGVVMHGANDDASGVTAVLELARTLSNGEPHRRGILFVAYGSEEVGGLGSQYFGAHSPVPLTDIVANLEIEMIGAQDPKMPAGVMMMTGFERSNFGSALRDKGALIAADLYPEQNFFERSDNYQLALEGVVAHTISGWAVTPTYHSPEDDIAHLDIPFMTRAIESLVAPLRWLASSDFRPEWAEGGRPQRRIR